MINLAVIEIKDIVKYLVRIMIVVTIIYALTRYFFGQGKFSKYIDENR